MVRVAVKLKIMRWPDMGIYLVLSFIVAILMLLSQYLSFHVTLYTPEHEKKRSKHWTFIILGGVAAVMFLTQTAVLYFNYRHEQDETSVSNQRRSAQDTITSQKLEKIETLLATSCFNSRDSNVAVQQCAAEVHKLRQEIQGSGLQVHTLNQPIDEPFIGRNWAFRPSISNPFSNLSTTPGTPINNQAQLSGSLQKHVSVPLVESVSLSENVDAIAGTGHGGCGVDRYGQAGGDCLTEECTIIVACGDAN